jgi:hypothetical protein
MFFGKRSLIHNKGFDSLYHSIAHPSSLTFLTDEIHFNDACEHRYDVHLRFYTPTVIYALSYHRIPIPVPVSFAIYIPPAVPTSSKLSSEKPYLNPPKCTHFSLPPSPSPSPHPRSTLPPTTTSLPHGTARHPYRAIPMSDIYTLAFCHCCTTHTYAGKCLIPYSLSKGRATERANPQKKIYLHVVHLPRHHGCLRELGSTAQMLCDVAASSGIAYAGMYEDVECV